MRFLLIAILFLSLDTWSQTKVYSDEFQNLSNLVLEISSSKIIKVNSVSNKVQLYTIRNNEVYIGNSNSYFDCAYSISKNQIFKGRSTSTFDVAYTFKDGKLFKGDGGFPNRVIFTFENGKIYSGDSSSVFDLIATYDLDREEDLILVALAMAPY